MKYSKKLIHGPTMQEWVGNISHYYKTEQTSVYIIIVITDITYIVLSKHSIVQTFILRCT
jgi:hypothetical protein